MTAKKKKKGKGLLFAVLILIVLLVLYFVIDLQQKKSDQEAKTEETEESSLPLSKAIIAIMVLYYGVGHWNSYFSALLYISDQDKYPLQLVLRNILITNQTALSQTATTAAARAALQEQQQLIDVMKYSLIIISSVPVLIMYPLVQKHFVKGVMIGSVKG